jgi:hypothetical protein
MRVREANGSRQQRLSVWGWTIIPILENEIGNVRLKSTNCWERKRRRHGVHNGRGTDFRLACDI